jgi:nucleoside 2-deoxyribosyltransferase
VYLAGPISGCNDDQRRHWRAEVHEKAKHFDIIDPTANLDPEASVYEVIERDLKCIEEADGLLVCMWKESIGTAVGMVHARAKGKVVVVADPNRLNNRMLEFYADAVVRTVGDAVKVLERLLRAERAVIVLKKDGSERPFDRGVLVESLREVCRRAGRHDIIVPQLVLVRALAELDGRIGRAGQHRVTTTDIERSVAGALAALEASEEHREAVGGVAEAWKARVGGKGAAEPSSRAAGDARPPVLAVSVASDKSHATDVLLLARSRGAGDDVEDARGDRGEALRQGRAGQRAVFPGARARRAEEGRGAAGD